ncbi:unnamed protein product [Closterium sp. NIES-64]|nr:unnamed protein product [Closterium sp. NIES-64]
MGFVLYASPLFLCHNWVVPNSPPCPPPRLPACLPAIPDSISSLTTLDGMSAFFSSCATTGLSPTASLPPSLPASLPLPACLPAIPDSISTLTTLEGMWHVLCCCAGSMISNNYLYGPLPDCLFDKCINQIDVSGNSLYGRINRDFKHMVANSGALVNLARNFFFGEAVLFAAGCKVCPTEVSEPNSLGLKDTSNWRVSDGNCNNALPSYLLQDYAVTGAGLKLRVSLSGNCLTLSPSTECSVNATQRSTAACQAFCSITDNGPCDGHGVCVPADPTSAAASRTASPSNFTCLCDAGYSTLDSGNGSTCAIVNSTTTTVSSLSTGAIVGITLGCFAGFILLAFVVTWLLWPRGPKKWEGLDVCEQFSLQQMLKATNNWSEDNVLGKGGFGIVYKGRSSHGQLWAIKRSTIMTNDFETEVRTMASLHHTHLVRLLGFCLDQNVETGKQEQILPANILVSADMQAKVADFGLLKRLTHGDADATRVAGTPGYVDPDYNRTNVITAKSDVFSFGIVLLELLSGKPPRVDAKTHISKWAMKRVEAYDLEELRDSKMPAVSEEAIVDFADLALDCIKSPGTRRPTMKDVACRLSALIAKHCPDREDEWESVAKEESEGNEGISSRDVSAVSFESSGREAESDVNL